jgi:glycosidase
VFYGDEIGMGEELQLEGRMSVRTPMQWSPGPAAGFSAVGHDQLVRPVVSGAFGPDEISVAVQQRTPDSLLHFMRRLIHERREAPELGWGVSTLVESEPTALFARRSDWQESTVVVVHNLAAEPVAAELELGADVEGVDDLLELREHRVDRGRLPVELDAYGYLWLRARRSRPSPRSRRSASV